MHNKFSFNAIQRDSIGVGFTVGLYGFSFGAIASAAHASTWQAMCLSSVLFSGGSQFALVGALAEGSSALSAVAVALFLGIRNALYAVRLRPITNDYSLLRRLVAGHITIDESAAMATAQDDPEDSKIAFWATGFGVLVFWNLFTLLGSLSGSFLKDPATIGLTAAAPAAFASLVWPRLRDRTGLRIALLAAAITLALLPWAPRGVPVLSSLLAIPIGVATAPKTAAAAHHESDHDRTIGPA